jgi:hypothetical protein
MSGLWTEVFGLWIEDEVFETAGVVPRIQVSGRF